MKITVFGAGYVGLVSGACLAEVGNHVLCVDIDTRKIQMLQKGELPIFEPGLKEMVRRNLDAGRLCFSTDIAVAVQHGTVQFIAVGTPPDEDGSADMQYVLAVARNIGKFMDDHKVVVNKSTVPVGTADKVHQVIAEALKLRASQASFAVVSNPEFLKEGAAVEALVAEGAEASTQQEIGASCSPAWRCSARHPGWRPLRPALRC